MTEQPPPLFWRSWSMPSADTFTMRPVSALLDRWLDKCAVVVDPFARNGVRGTHRNDLNPDTAAQWHMDARAFCDMLIRDGVKADAVLFDPPYSPRQIAEVYQGIGLNCSMEDTQSSRLYRDVRDGLATILKPGGVAISFGWNSTGFGTERGFLKREVLLVAHGGAHNDTIVTVEVAPIHRVAAPVALPFCDALAEVI